MAINLAAERDLLVPGLREVTGEYKDLPRLYDKIFEVATSNMAQERTAAMQFVGLATLKAEGAATTFDNSPGERWVYNQTHNTIGLGYAITREAIEDNLYKKQFRPTNLGLQKSFNQTKEIYGANILNTATTYNSAVGGDGVSLCNTAHPVTGFNIGNRPSIDVDLNEASLLNAQATIRANWRDNAGLKLVARARKLVVPIALEPIAVRLLETPMRPGTSDNDVNAIPRTSGGFSDGHLVHDYLTSNYAWFVLTDVPGLLYLQRTPYETSMQVDFVTENLLVKGFERYSFGYYDWRNIWGSFPTS